MLVMKENSFFHSDLKIVLVMFVPASLERFAFLIGLIDLGDSAIFIFLNFFEYFSKDLYMSKTLFQEIKPIISSCFLYIKKKLSRNY